MLPQYCRVLLLALLGVKHTFAIRIHPPAYCVDGCAAAIGYILYEGAAELDYYDSTCNTDIFVGSVVDCALVYCPPDNIKKGIEAYNATCKAYSPYYIKPYDELMEGKTAKSLAAITRVPQGSKTIYNESAIPDESFFKNGLRTATAFDSNINDSWNFGYACIGFWSIVLLIGMVNRLIVMIKQHGSYQTITKDVTNRPIALPRSTSSWLRRNLILPGTFGGRVQYAFGGWCTIPPRLEAILLALFVLMNFIFCFPAYDLFLGNVYYAKTKLQLARYIADRTGVLSIANFPMVWLFATRNDPFLWLTGWSFASFNRFHRWVARIATIEAIVHSIAYSVFSDINGSYKSAWLERYWYMGGVATITMSLMLGFSLYWLRDRHYDLFLVLHIVLALVTLIGLWYHVDIFEGEYSGWLWICIAIWSFDRLLRVGRIIYLSIIPRVTRNVTAVATYSPETDLIRLDVTDYFPNKGADPGIFYYVYQPGSLRGYESHPFTLCSWVRGSITDGNPSASRDLPSKKEFTTTEHSTTTSASEVDEVSHSFLVRPYAGFTGRLRNKLLKEAESRSTQVTLLLEGPYGDRLWLDRFTDVLIIAGGSGITAAISHSCALLQHRSCSTRIHIVWAVRQMALVEDVVKNELSAVVGQARVQTDIYYTPDENAKEVQTVTITPYTVHDGRPDIEQVLSDDHKRCEGSLAMVCCGPPAMADACRSAVVKQLGKGGVGIEFINDTMVW